MNKPVLFRKVTSFLIFRICYSSNLEKRVRWSKMLPAKSLRKALSLEISFSSGESSRVRMTVSAAIVAYSAPPCHGLLMREILYHVYSFIL